MNNNQVKYIRALNAWIDVGHPTEGPDWEEYKMVLDTLTPEELHDLDNATSAELTLPDPVEKYAEYDED